MTAMDWRGHTAGFLAAAGSSKVKSWSHDSLGGLRSIALGGGWGGGKIECVPTSTTNPAPSLWGAKKSPPSNSRRAEIRTWFEAILQRVHLCGK